MENKPFNQYVSWKIHSAYHFNEKLMKMTWVFSRDKHLIIKTSWHMVCLEDFKLKYHSLQAYNNVWTTLIRKCIICD